MLEYDVITFVSQMFFSLSVKKLYRSCRTRRGSCEIPCFLFSPTGPTVYKPLSIVLSNILGPYNFTFLYKYTLFRDKILQSSKQVTSLTNV